MNRTEPTKLFTVVRGDDGTVSVDWGATMRPLVDDDGKTTNRVIDLTEEILGVGDGEE